ncbi:MAG: hypothetical protein KAJ73_05580 [Zetaproteobacteria bacterium]|nr:hypothetical protein [Zetaproteobacteria bacterium]
MAPVLLFPEWAIGVEQGLLAGHNSFHGGAKVKHREIYDLLSAQDYKPLGDMGAVCRGLDEARIPYDILTMGNPGDIKILPDGNWAKGDDWQTVRVSIVFPPADEKHRVVPIIDFDAKFNFQLARVEAAWPLGYRLWDDDPDYNIQIGAP